jgi:hypothetical protein
MTWKTDTRNLFPELYNELELKLLDLVAVMS